MDTFIIENMVYLFIIAGVIIALIVFPSFKKEHIAKKAGKAYSGLASLQLIVSTVIAFSIVMLILGIANVLKVESLTQAVIAQYNVKEQDEKVELDTSNSDWQNITFKDSENNDVVLSIRVTDWKNNIVEVKLPKVANIDYTLESLKRAEG